MTGPIENRSLFYYKAKASLKVFFLLISDGKERYSPRNNWFRKSTAAGKIPELLIDECTNFRRIQRNREEGNDKRLRNQLVRILQ